MICIFFSCPPFFFLVLLTSFWALPRDIGIILVLVPPGLGHSPSTEHCTGMLVVVMSRGGEVALKWSNRLMRWRVMLQALTIVLIIAFILASQNA